MKSLITCMHTQAEEEEPQQLDVAGKTSSLPFRSPCRAPLLSSLFICIFSLKESSNPSFRQRRCHTLARLQPDIRSTLSVRSVQFKPGHYQAHKYVLSVLCIISPLPFWQAHLTSASRLHLPRDRDAASSCVYITHHLRHRPIRSRSREADLESTELQQQIYTFGSRQERTGAARAGRPAGQRRRRSVGFIRVVITMQGIPECVLAECQSKGHMHANTSRWPQTRRQHTPHLGAVTLSDTLH